MQKALLKRQDQGLFSTVSHATANNQGLPVRSHATENGQGSEAKVHAQPVFNASIGMIRVVVGPPLEPNC